MDKASTAELLQFFFNLAGPIGISLCLVSFLFVLPVLLTACKSTVFSPSCLLQSLILTIR